MRRRSRSRSRPAFRVAVVALSLRSARRVAVAALPRRSVRRVGRRSRSRPVRRFAVAALPARARLAALCFGAAVSGGGKGSLCDLLCGALARARLTAVRLRRSRSARFAALGGALALLGSPRWAALSLTLGSPRCCGALAHARLAALRLRRSRSRPGGFYLINIYLNIIINQSRRRREAPAFRTAKKYAPSGGVFPLSDIYFCFAYSAIALYFSKSSGRRMRALAGLVEGSSMHGMQPQGSQNRL